VVPAVGPEAEPDPRGDKQPVAAGDERLEDVEEDRWRSPELPYGCPKLCHLMRVGAENHVIRPDLASQHWTASCWFSVWLREQLMLGHCHRP
jgi:hypothetical protein